MLQNGFLQHYIVIVVHLDLCTIQFKHNIPFRQGLPFKKFLYKQSRGNYSEFGNYDEILKCTLQNIEKSFTKKSYT